MTWRIFKWEIVEWEKQDAEKHVIHDPTFIKKHIKQNLHVYACILHIIWELYEDR